MLTYFLSFICDYYSFKFIEITTNITVEVVFFYSYKQFHNIKNS